MIPSHPQCRRFTFLVFFSLFTHVVIEAAHPRSNPRRTSSTDYDRIISTFSPEGRLEQVEYSAQAATRTILAAVDHQRIIVVAPTGSRLEPIFGPDAAEPSVDHGKDDEDSDTTTTTATPPSSSCCWMMGTGIAGDVLWLRDNLRRQAVQCQIVWDDTAATVERLVREVADSCHSLTFLAGARPLGAAACVVAWETKGPQLLELSGWKGAVVHSTYACLGPHQDTMRSILQRRNLQDSGSSTMVRGLVDVAQQVLGKKESLDVWVLNRNGTIRQYTNIRDRSSRRRLEEWIQEAESEEDA